MDRFLREAKRIGRRLLGMPGIASMVTGLVRRNPIFSQSFRNRLSQRVPIRQAVVSAALPNGRSIRLRHDGFDEIAKAIFWNGFTGYDGETVTLFFERCRTARVVLDVGANIGYYSLLAALANPEARVFAFEPVSELKQRLIEHIKLNEVFERVTVTGSAVSDRNGEISLYIPANRVFAESSILKGFREHVAEIKVPTVTLDAFVEEKKLSVVDVVKIDVEGAEEQVFCGMTGILADLRPDIVCEVLPGRFTKTSEELLRTNGYKFFWIKGGRILRADRIVGDREYRCLNYYFSTRM